MKQFNLSEQEARIFIRGMIVETEETCRKLDGHLRRKYGSTTIESYIDAMELMLGGNCFWSSTCPRYNPDYV
ncbi:hypothetical protein F1880_001967 [Penicillium rolfsii]|nr:hypothetical protein F1880_001967 [Penicillium rolfsii]